VKNLFPTLTNNCKPQSALTGIGHLAA